MSEFKHIISAFDIPGNPVSFRQWGSGHINETWRARYAEGELTCDYILQRINADVFTDVPALMENIGKVTRHQRSKLESMGAEEIDRRVLTLIATQSGENVHQDDAGHYWRLFRFIEHARAVDIVETPGQAYEAAKAFGEFQYQLADLPGRLHETIPRFHDTPSRFNDLVRAIQLNPLNRATGVRAEIEYALQQEAVVDRVVNGLASGDIPERVTHNDTKLNNVLLDSTTGKGLCVIDLDTVMPGSALYDFGDLVRATTSTAPEDGKDLSQIQMDPVYFEALVRGYLESASGFLVEAERELLAFSGQLISLELGMRFLTDHLQGDTYFKIQHAGQNLQRCQRQFAMAKSMQRHADLMETIVQKYPTG